MKSLKSLAYAKIAETKGIEPRLIKEGKKYKLLSDDGVNFIHLGKCVENDLIVSGHPMDPSFERHLNFEENNDNPLFPNIIYGDPGSSANLNIYLDESEGGRKRKTNRKKSKGNTKSHKRKGCRNK
jgi:hypothetical protein